MSNRFVLNVEPRVSKNNKPYMAVYVRTDDGKEIFLSPSQNYKMLFEFCVKQGLIEKCK